MHRPSVFLATVPLLVSLTSTPARAQCPAIDPAQSFYVPQAGPVATPSEGLPAYRFFRRCPNNDGGSSLPNNARIKVVLRDAAGAPLAGVPRNQIYILFNGGTLAQGFPGIGADEIIANSTWNVMPLCPDVRHIQADADTDVNGVTYITLTGADPANPGVGVRDPNLKWGHWDSLIPVYVGDPPCAQVPIQGRLTSAAPPNTYVLQVKNVDVAGGLQLVMNTGEMVTITDYNVCFNCITNPGGAICSWCDFDFSGLITALDVNVLFAHMTHDCDTPFSP